MNKIHIRITDVGGPDAWYTDRQRVIGITGWAWRIMQTEGGWFEFDFNYEANKNETIPDLYFGWAKYEVLK